MKTLYILILVLVITRPASTVAQQSISGSWQVDIQATINNLSNAGKIRYNDIPAEAKEAMRQSFGSRKFTFQEDGTMLMHVAKRNEPAKGTWAFKQGSKDKLIITIAGQPNEMEVVQLTPTVLVLELGDTGGVFEKLYLDRL